MGVLSRQIVRRVAPLLAVGAASAAGALLAQRRLAERRKMDLVSVNPQPGTPGPDPSPPVPGPDPIPTPTPAPEPPAPPSPTPGPIPAPTPEPQPPTPPSPAPGPQPGIAIAGNSSQGPEAASDVVVEPSLKDAGLEQAVRAALLDAAPGGAGAVDVEVAGGMVVLRGRVDNREAIRELERAAASVGGVEGVRVLLHLPGRAVKRSA